MAKSEEWNMKFLGCILTLAVILNTAAVYAGDLKVSESMIDYGTIKEGPPVVKKVLLTNAGSQTLAIANVTTS
jgi:hypothetical protein